MTQTQLQHPVATKPQANSQTDNEETVVITTLSMMKTRESMKMMMELPQKMITMMKTIKLIEAKITTTALARVERLHHQAVENRKTLMHKMKKITRLLLLCSYPYLYQLKKMEKVQEIEESIPLLPCRFQQHQMQQRIQTQTQV